MPFLGEIRLFSFGLVPRGWVPCDGRLLPIMQNQALYSLLGTTYGGDGQLNFALPDLRGKVPVHPDYEHKTIMLGQKGGEESHRLTIMEMPQHTHTAACSTETANNKTAASNIWAKTNSDSYGTSAVGLMSMEAVSSVGGNQPHPNMQPYTVVNFCIAVSGEYPLQN
ncbi:phage tail protein [Brevibacillus fulvus]|uniref:Microcystin-dependent protein n=1 Tax=Brevibacillus fulvus TaxID=1125967 RepID=A0A939BTP2_9BACL|nr:tail fiber protein [Brevibacillus fulvus]MBM7591723.1 microcystin-dependent protein [Brevibacillus fulvus]